MKVAVQVAVLVVVGVALIAGSLVFQRYFSSVFDKMLSNKLLLVPGSKTLESFKSPPVPIFMQFWLFNVTNSEEVLGGAVPVLQQVGPYTFEEKQLKYNLTFHDHEGSVTYLQNKSFYFREDLSEGHKESDKITTINAIMMSIGSKFEGLPSALKGIIEIVFVRFSVTPFITKPVGELLFYGYDEPMLKQLAPMTKDPVHATGKFGFFYPKNNSNDGTYTVYTGVKDMAEYQHIVRWKGEEHIDFWKRDMWGGNSCNMINGTTGNQFPPLVSKHEPLRLYTAELCRSIYAVFQKEVTHGHLTLYRYVLPAQLLANSPENKCFCTDDFTCRPSMINVAPCRKGAPVVMSTPHFYQGEIEDAQQVVGLDPREEEHETYLDIEPTTGVTFRAAKRIQVNIPLRQYSNLPSFRSVPDVILPVLWVNESVEVPLARTAALHRTLTLPFTLVNVATWVLVTLGVILILVAVVKVVLTHRKSHPKKRTVNEKDKDGAVTEKLNDKNYS
ncbi:lysosome membrane protein 2-like [Homarus americanus]|uniref:Lysosome membrane protein 2-like 3 n=1 Tax=Homarus americanus TaxID=6706 RepID=A0A8J5KDJ4_HOMAM|nr:lysosome membrane protein 2-like [Homarus americanus]KAG7170474.1 Lysosome membrane protein 2-like 3 [Homarus americanus]